MDDYRPAEYWEKRLLDEKSLRGTGHISYSERYNRLMYRRKGNVLRRVLRGLPSMRTTLDIGSGTGWVIEQLLEAGSSRVDGVDISPSVAQRLKRRFPTSQIFCHALGSDPLPIPDESYDASTMIDVAYHITDEAVFDAAIHDVARALTVTGSLIVTDAFGARSWAPVPHVRFRSANRWRQTASNAGLRVKTVLPLFAWFARSRHESRLRYLPDGLRGVVEYVGEIVVPRPPHLRLAVLVKDITAHRPDATSERSERAP